MTSHQLAVGWEGWHGPLSCINIHESSYHSCASGEKQFRTTWQCCLESIEPSTTWIFPKPYVLMQPQIMTYCDRLILSAIWASRMGSDPQRTSLSCASCTSNEDSLLKTTWKRKRLIRLLLIDAHYQNNLSESFQWKSENVSAKDLLLVQKQKKEIKDQNIPSSNLPLSNFNVPWPTYTAFVSFC